MLSWKNWHSLEVYFISELLTIFLGLFFLGGLSCGEANARMGDCESGPIAACLFLLSVLSFVSYSKRKVIEWNEMF